MSTFSFKIGQGLHDTRARTCKKGEGILKTQNKPTADMHPQSVPPVKKGAIDKAVFFPAMIVTLVMGIVFMFNPTGSQATLSKIHAFTTHQLGWSFLLFTFGTLMFCLFFVFSRYGNVVLGREGEKPEFSTLSWLGMIFTSGTGGSLLYGGAVEWIYFMQQPPMGAEVGSVEAARWAATYGMFHWGPSAWGFYVAAALPIAYTFYAKRKPTMKMSEFARPLLKEKVDGPAGHFINFIYLFGILGGVMTSLGLGTPLIANGIAYCIGMDHSSTFLEVLVIVLWTMIPMGCLIFGLKKGVAKLSDLNVKLDIFMILALLILGPTAYILNQSTDSLGLMMQNFVTMSLTTDTIGGGGFPQDWTVFYFAWWAVYALPFGLFIAKISKGRTMREMVIGALTAGSLGCMSFYMVLTNFGMHLQHTGAMDVVGYMGANGRGRTIIEVISHAPGGVLMVALFTGITLISYFTGHNAVGWSLAAGTQKQIGQDEDPAKWNMSFWLILAGVVSLALFLIDKDGLKPLQTMSILTGFPVCGVLFLIYWAFMKQLKKDFAHGVQTDDEGKAYAPEGD